MAISQELFYFFLRAPDCISHSSKEVTPSDAVELDVVAHAIYVGDTSGGSDITVVTLEGNEVTFKNLIQGQVIDTGYIKQIKSTGTNAAALVVFYNVTDKKV